MELENKRAFVTGGASGIGQAAAYELARRGTRVAIHYYKNRDGAQETAATISREFPHLGEVPLLQADLGIADNARRLVNEAQETLGGLDILVNNAGDLLERRPLAEIDEKLWLRVFDVNVSSTLFCSQAAAPGMMKQGSGSIVNVSSLAAWNGGGPGAAPYSMAKGAVVSLSKALAKELAPHGIRVNCVSPGLIGETGFHARFTKPDAFDGVAKSVPLARAGTPKEVADVICFLAGSHSSYLTGETIEINGGLLMR